MADATLGELNTEIFKLQEVRQNLLNQQKLAETQSIIDLEWTKDYKAFFKINGLSGAGLPRYSILVYGNPPHHLSSVVVMGEHSLYEYNILYGKDFMVDTPSFYTSNTELLLKFLEKVQFKELEFDEDLLRVLKAAEVSSVKYSNHNAK